MTTFTLQDLNLPTTAEQAVETITKEKWMEYGMNNPISTSAIEYATQHAPAPQPTLADIVNSICTQLQLLTTVLTSSQAETKAGENSLQECVSTTLQQADWFKEMVAQHLKDMGVDDIAESVVENLVERDVENYFSNSFDPTDHFDFGDAVSNEVSDQLDDVVRDRLDEVVQEQLEEIVAEKLKSIRVVFD
jgi:hypothetical protein